MGFFRFIFSSCLIIRCHSGINQRSRDHRQDLLYELETKNEEHPLHTHVFRESIPRRSSRSDLIRLKRIHQDYVHEVVFFIQQRNMDELTRVLHDVSDPLSPNYGQHWTKEEVADLTANPVGSDAVIAYLHAIGVSTVSETQRGEYITANAPIAIWEKMFSTEFFTFHQLHPNDREIGRASCRERVLMSV